MRRSIGIRLAGGFLLMISLSTAIVLSATRPLSELTSIARVLSQLDIAEVNLLWKMRLLLVEIDHDIRRLVIPGASARDSRPLRRRMDRVGELLSAHERLQDHHAAPQAEEGDLLHQFSTALRALEELKDDVLARVQQGRTVSVATLVTGRWAPLHQTTVQSLDRLLDHERRETRRHAEAAEAKSIAARRLLIMLALVAVLASIVLASTITLSITRPIRKLVATTDRITRGEVDLRADVTSGDEIGRLARRFNGMLDRIARSRENQRRFFADVSHEIRTALTVIRGEAEVVLRGPHTSVENYREGLNMIVATVGHLSGLVDGLLFLARSEAGEIEYAMAPVELSELVAEVAREVEGLIALSELELKIDLDGPAVVTGDAAHLRQLFFTLLDNAIRYTGSGGEIMVRLETAPNRVRVLVSDTGVGIAAQHLPRVFERFYSVTSTTTDGQPSEPGSGLGLSIAAVIVEAHQGEITVESTRGVGTTLTVMLPLAPSQEGR